MLGVARQLGKKETRRLPSTLWKAVMDQTATMFGESVSVGSELVPRFRRLEEGPA